MFSFYSDRGCSMDSGSLGFGLEAQPSIYNQDQATKQPS